VTFVDLLRETSRRNRSLLCVGLDPILEQLPAGVERSPSGVLAFNRAIIEATSDLVCAYKPNSAFFEALGAEGFEVLRQTIAAVPPGIPVILDAKRGDISSTAAGYAYAAFEFFGAHAVTLNPYLGGDSLEPFTRYHDRGCIILCRTSNPGGDDLQAARMADGRPLYQHVARLVQTRWNSAGNCGLVVGATYPRELAEVRELCPDLPLLVPGVGAQGGALEPVVRAAVDRHGDLAIINASRSILFASADADFSAAARAETQRLRTIMEDIRAQLSA
jgi:orotidine-5'-phosphate decarboxylase